MSEERIIKTDSVKAWLLAARPKTLTGAAVPVMIGVALAWVDAKLYDGEAFNWVAALLCLLFSFSMQIDANFINDFFDFVNGTDDAETRLGPRRACAQGWVRLDSMKKAIALTTCIGCMIGLPLAWFGGMEMILVGALCVVFAFLYTTFFSFVLWHRARLLQLLCATSHHYVAGIPGFIGMWTCNRCFADSEQLPR